MQIISICLSDIPKENITKSDKNGKSYISLVVNSRKEPDQFGNTLTVTVSQTKIERERKEKKTYVGSGKEYNYKPTNKDSDTDDLQF